MFEGSDGQMHPCGHIDVHGRPQERSKHEYPYAYSPYVIVRLRPNPEKMSSYYDDRMRQWDYDKYRRCQKEAGIQGDWLSEYDGETLEKFVRLYFDKPELELIAVEQCCNVATGYPIHIFHVARD